MKKNKIITASIIAAGILLSGLNINSQNNQVYLVLDKAEAAAQKTEFVKYISASWGKVSSYTYNGKTFSADKSKFSKLAQYRTYEINWFGWKVTKSTFYKVVYK
ncbi:hypothetical protein [Macrococcus carouselicus]|uniref:Uncharacterized protein n=1 Tax=Macrococcus carouselicus TaxID=69969 RepID=A0A9Q8CJM3_9STAP|nr:hypothetical protein [Macrococcus carouselicus]TDL95540.1 hypothetical protein ERX40_10175 [Macrococcus carouselicus]